MNVLIVEDEIMAQANLARILEQNFPDIRIVGTACSAKEAVAWLKDPHHHADVIFMDVELSDGDCFSIFRQVEVTSKVIMTTAYDSYAIKAFEAGSIDYLLKPVELNALKRAVARCRTSRERFDAEALMNLLKTDRKVYKERFIVKFNDRIIPVRSSEIAYFYSEEKINFLVTVSENNYVIDSSLDQISEELDPDRFFRISRSCIVSASAIVSIVKKLGGRLRIVARPESSFEMIVSRSRSDDFLEWLEK